MTRLTHQTLLQLLWDTIQKGLNDNEQHRDENYSQHHCGVVVDSRKGALRELANLAKVSTKRTELGLGKVFVFRFKRRLMKGSMVRCP